MNKHTAIRQALCATIPSNWFDYDRDHTTFYADISSISHVTDPLRRVWSDACDAGFIMQSVKTQAKILFTLETEHRDLEGDISHWTFKPYGEIDPNTACLSVTIYNT